jgi:hypothetical protein
MPLKSFSLLRSWRVSGLRAADGDPGLLRLYAEKNGARITIIEKVPLPHGLHRRGALLPLRQGGKAAGDGYARITKSGTTAPSRTSPGSGSRPRGC